MALVNGDPIPQTLIDDDRMLSLFEAYLLSRSLSQPPWALGLNIPRRQFRRAATVMSIILEAAAANVRHQSGCPIMQALGGE